MGQHFGVAAPISADVEGDLAKELDRLESDLPERR